MVDGLREVAGGMQMSRVWMTGSDRRGVLSCGFVLKICTQDGRLKINDKLCWELEAYQVRLGWEEGSKLKFVRRIRHFV